jgi:DNA-binding LacI/PurR family transcriptional regulator
MVDIARRSGVAVSTVSYVLSGKRVVSAETRERVQRAIDELGFRPHEPARALKSRSSRAITLFYPATRHGLEIDSHIFLSGVLEATSEAGYALLVSTATLDPAGIVAPLETGRADGVILMEVRLADDRVERLRKDDFPFSMIGRCANNDGLSYVDFDFDDAVTLALHHLHELGHRHVALLDRAPSITAADYSPTVWALQGFERTLKDLSMEGEHLLCGSSGADYIEVLRFFERLPDCTAAIAVSVTFVPLLTALRDLGRRVPNDFSVISIVAPPISDLLTSQLCTIDVPAHEMGRLGAELLLQRLAEPDAPPSQMLLRGSLTGQSSGPPPRRLASTSLGIAPGGGRK